MYRVVYTIHCTYNLYYGIIFSEFGIKNICILGYQSFFASPSMVCTLFFAWRQAAHLMLPDPGRHKEEAGRNFKEYAFIMD